VPVVEAVVGTVVEAVVGTVVEAVVGTVVEAVVGTVVEGAARVVDVVSVGVLLGVDSGWGVGDAGGGCGAVKILV
jgi:hypothetical protein